MQQVDKALLALTIAVSLLVGYTQYLNFLINKLQDEVKRYRR